NIFTEGNGSVGGAQNGGNGGAVTILSDHGNVNIAGQIAPSPNGAGAIVATGFDAANANQTPGDGAAITVGAPAGNIVLGGSGIFSRGGNSFNGTGRGGTGGTITLNSGGTISIPGEVISRGGDG